MRGWPITKPAGLLGIAKGRTKRHGTQPCLLFALAHELAGESSIELSLPAPATAGDAEDALKKRYEWLGERLSSYRIAVDEEFGGKDTPLRDGSELAIIPPVSGG